jgi:hypothetical protein
MSRKMEGSATLSVSWTEAVDKMDGMQDKGPAVRVVKVEPDQSVPNNDRGQEVGALGQRAEWSNTL